MSKVSYCDSILLLDVGEEWSFVVDLEIKDTVLVGELEGRGVDCGCCCCGGRHQVEAVERREHGEFELD